MDRWLRPAIILSLEMVFGASFEALMTRWLKKKKTIKRRRNTSLSEFLLQMVFQLLVSFYMVPA